MSREFADLIRKWLPTLIVTETSDAASNPVVNIFQTATPVAGQKNLVVRTQPVAWPEAKDIFGNAAASYSNHVMQLCTEANPAGGAGADVLTPVELLPALVEMGRKGTEIEWYNSANGTVPATGQMTSGNLKATWKDLYWSISKAI